MPFAAFDLHKREIEACLIDESGQVALRRRFPGCVVVGEEAASADPSLLGVLGDAELAFVVDPVDGTANFAAGLALFGVMAAVFRRATTSPSLPSVASSCGSAGTASTLEAP